MALKKTGVELVAEGDARFNAALTNADKSVKTFGNDVVTASNKVNAAGGNFDKVSAKIDSMGRNARIGFGAAGQAAALFGSDVSGTLGPLAMASDAIGDMVGAVGSLGAATGVIGVVVSAFAFLIQKQNEWRNAVAESIKANDAQILSLSELAKTNEDVAQRIDAIAQAEARLAEARVRATGRSAGAMAGEIEAANKEIQAQRDYLNAVYGAATEASNALEELRTSTGYAASAAYEHQNALNAEKMEMDYAAAAANRLAEAMGDTRGDAIKDYREGARSVAEMNTKAWLATHEFKEGAGWVEKIDKNAASAASKLSQIASKFRSMVESSLNFTPVTDEDMAASAAGTYTDKWDEFLRRAKAVQSGTDPSQFGDEFQAQLQKLNMPLDQIISKFQSFQLFVGGQNFDLVNFDAITAQIEEQLLGVAGKASLTEEAMRRVWANLSPTARATLATTGIENAEDALKQFLDPAGVAAEKVGDLNSEIKNIPTLVTTTFDVVKAPTFDPVLAQIAEDLSIIPSAADILVTIYYESANKPPDNGGDDFNNGGTPPPGYARGGAGIFGADQLVRVHAGEGFWFSGTQWQHPIPSAFGSMVEPAAPSSAYYGGDMNAPIAVNINANLASSVDVNALATRVANTIRDRVLTVKRAGA